MIIKENRTKLDQALGNDKTTILLLAGPDGSQSGAIHNFVMGYDWEPWRLYFLLTDLTILTSAEQDQWFDGPHNNHYAVVGGPQVPKVVARKGPVKDLLRNNGKPSILKIRSAFAAGDQL